MSGVINAMDQLYPGLGHHLEEETTVAIDGAIHETPYFRPIRPGCDVFFIPKLEGRCQVRLRCRDWIVRKAPALCKHTFAATEIDDAGALRHSIRRTLV